MNQPAASAGEINRLHAEVVRLTVESKASLHTALASAWQAGQLLLAEKKRVRQAMGAGAWLEWLARSFRGSRRTAQNYMRLADTVADVSFLRGLSLRQVYLRLGIATEPKTRAESVQVAPLPAHVRLAGKLVRELQGRKLAPEKTEAYRQDLRALYEQLRRLFEPQVNQTAAPVSKRYADPAS